MKSNYTKLFSNFLIEAYAATKPTIAKVIGIASIEFKANPLLSEHTIETKNIVDKIVINFDLLISSTYTNIKLISLK